MHQRNQAGRATGSLILLLLVFSAAGGWNYHRNLKIEESTEGARPYARYAAEDLKALRDAYTTELEGTRSEFATAKRQRTRVVGDVGSIAANVKQFQQATRTSSAIRAAAAGVADTESQLATLDREFEMRLRFGEGFERHLKRLTTI